MTPLPIYAQDKDKPVWDKSMALEYDSLIKNKTCTLAPLPPGKNLVECKWIYKTRLLNTHNLKNINLGQWKKDSLNKKVLTILKLLLRLLK